MGVTVREWKGAWWIFVNHRGRRKARRVGAGKAGGRAARLAAEQIQARLALGDLSPLAVAPVPAPLPTFREYVARWLESHVRLRCKPSSLEHYTQVLHAHWVPHLGALPLDAITRERVRTTLAALATRLRATTIRHSSLVVLRACLSGAVEDGLIPANPAARLGRYVRSNVEPREPVDPFTREELLALLGQAEGEMPEWYPLLLTMARAGLRFGEVTALSPGDLDFRERALWIRRAAYKGRVSTPKSNKGRRVDMSRQLAGVLQGWLSLREAEAVVSGQPAADWLFPAPKGGLLHEDWFIDRVWRPLLRRAGLRYRGPHQLRHSFATLLLAAGESLPYVRDQLGHHSIKLTVDTYWHYLPGSNRKAVDGLDDATTRNPRATGGAGVRRIVAEDQAPLEAAAHSTGTTRG